MSMLHPALLAPLLVSILLVAMLYSSVGHGGASGYIAVMALFAIAPAAFKPTALVLNILVSAVATWCFARAGHFSLRLFLPFAVTSIPCSFLGGYLSLPPRIFQPLVGVVLLFSACRLLMQSRSAPPETTPPPAAAALLVGAVLGLLSGLTGVGGGIFLSPILLLLKWGKPQEVSAAAALFILVNSAAGLLGHLASLRSIPDAAPFLAAAALAGGIVGSSFGSRLPAGSAVRLLSVVLGVAGLKLLLI